MIEVLNQEQTESLYQKSANSLYKEYKNSGGTLSFKDFIQREKDKGVFPINLQLNEEVQQTLNEYRMKKQEKKPAEILGLPVNTLVIAGSIIVIAVVTYKIIQNRRK